MRTKAFTGLLLLLLLLAGCSAGKEVSGDAKPPARPIPHIETILLGMPAEQVRDLYGDPEEKVKETGAELFDMGSTHRWTLLQGNEELWMVTEKGVVVRFFRRRYASP